MNVADLTCEEVNYELYKRRGECTVCKDPNAEVIDMLDYCHDWRWAGELLEEMKVPQLYMQADCSLGWRCEPCWDMAHPKGLPPPGANAPIPTEAISRAWLEMVLEAE